MDYFFLSILIAILVSLLISFEILPHNNTYLGIITYGILLFVLAIIVKLVVHLIYNIIGACLGIDLKSLFGF